MSDKQTWWLPRPQMRSSVRRDAAGEIQPYRVCVFGEEYLAKLDAWRDLAPDDDDSELTGSERKEDPQHQAKLQAIQFDLFIFLLRANYDLTFDEAADLIAFDMGDPADRDRYLQLIQLAQGVIPKVAGDGLPPA